MKGGWIMEILKQNSIEKVEKVWEEQQEKTVSQMSCCCYCGD